VSSKEITLRLAIVLIAIVSIGLVAATIASPVDPGSEGYGPQDEEAVGQPVADTDVDESADGEIPDIVQYLFFAVLILAAIAFVWYAINNHRQVITIVAIILVLMVISAAVYWLIATFILDGGFEMETPAGDAEDPDQEPGGGDGGDGETETTAFDFAPIIGLLAVLALIFVGGLALSNRSSDDDDPLTDPSVEDGPDDRVAVAAAAGRAADRITETATAEIDNEVYRAWEEMTQLLDVDRPETTTPGEFADVAVDAGIDEAHVTELTELFEAVRYGHESTTDEREQQAIDTLRAIESSYGVDGDDGSNTGDST